MKRKALITGITGQDGSYLAEFLLKNGYDVYGIARSVAFEDSSHRLNRISHLLDDITLFEGTLDSFANIFKIITKEVPDEVYHLAAKSYVSYNLEDEFSTLQSNINGTHYVLSSCKELIPNVKFYFAGSSEMFGKVLQEPQDENTRFNPRSLYGISKVAGFQLTKNYREYYNLYACNGILYNHESPRRGYEFVTRKITHSIGEIYHGLKDKILLGNLDSRRDWGYAKDYVVAMYLMLQQKKPDDYVVATGRTHSVREFVEKAFNCIDIQIEWNNSGIEEYGIDKRSGRILVEVDRRFFRPAEENQLVGNADKARQILGWEETVSFEDLIELMVTHDLKEIERKKAGYLNENKYF